MTLDCPRVCFQLRTSKNLKIRLQSERIPNRRKKYLCLLPPIIKKPFSKICSNRLLRCFFIMAIISAKLLRYVRQVLMFLRLFNYNKNLKKTRKKQKKQLVVNPYDVDWCVPSGIYKTNTFTSKIRVFFATKS